MNREVGFEQFALGLVGKSVGMPQGRNELIRRAVQAQPERMRPSLRAERTTDKLSEGMGRYKTSLPYPSIRYNSIPRSSRPPSVPAGEIPSGGTHGNRSCQVPTVDL
jgi:hypothetical protein